MARAHKHVAHSQHSLGVGGNPGGISANDGDSVLRVGFRRDREQRGIKTIKFSYAIIA